MIQLVKIDGKKIVELSRTKKEITFKDLVDCLADDKVVDHITKNSILKFQGEEGRLRAILTI